MKTTVQIMRQRHVSDDIHIQIVKVDNMFRVDITLNDHFRETHRIVGNYLFENCQKFSTAKKALRLYNTIL